MNQKFTEQKDASFIFFKQKKRQAVKPLTGAVSSGPLAAALPAEASRLPPPSAAFPNANVDPSCQKRDVKWSDTEAQELTKKRHKAQIETKLIPRMCRKTIVVCFLKLVTFRDVNQMWTCRWKTSYPNCTYVAAAFGVSLDLLIEMSPKKITQHVSPKGSCHETTLNMQKQDHVVHTCSVASHESVLLKRSCSLTGHCFLFSFLQNISTQQLLFCHSNAPGKVQKSRPTLRNSDAWRGWEASNILRSEASEASYGESSSAQEPNFWKASASESRLASWTKTSKCHSLLQTCIKRP